MSSSYMKLYQEFLQKKSAFSNIERIDIPPSSPENSPTADSECVKTKEETIPEEKKSPEKAEQLGAETINDMEHSYTRDVRPAPLLTGLTPARTLLVRRPPQCPSCHAHPMDENNEMDEANQPVIPTYNETVAKDAMNECSRIAKNVKNLNPDDQDWQERVNQNGWTVTQEKLFAKIAKVLDVDQLGRLANSGRQHEPIQRRVVIDKSAQRFRKALAAVAWEPRLTQWLHSLLMECLPPSYMASYLDILQTLKTKLPSLIDKMLFGRPMNISQDLLAPVLKKQWEPVITSQQKSRKLPHSAVIIALPSMPVSGGLVPVPSRIQKWYQHLATITQIVQITLPAGSSVSKQPLENIAEQIVSLTRLKIQELRNEQPNRNIVLVGFNAGASLALQVAMVESVSSVICLGFAYNTLNGARGTPDDRILDIKTPVLFVIGQNSARTSQEEIELLREKMQSDTSMVVVGSADDVLRVPKSKRKIENVSQSMVDVMVVDEVYEFIKKILLNPPGPRIPVINNQILTSNKKVSNDIQINQRKRKLMGMDSSQIPAKIKCGTKSTTPGNTSSPLQKYQRKPKPPKDSLPVKRKVGRPRTRPLPETIAAQQPLAAKQPVKQIVTQPSNDDLNLAIQSILGEGDTPTKPSIENRTDVTNFEIVSQPKAAHIKTILGPGIRAPNQPLSLGTSPSTKIKMIPSNQFVQLKPPKQSQTKIYTIKPTSIAPASSITSSPTVSGSQIFTIKPTNSNQTQIVTVGNQPKFTILKTSPIKPLNPTPTTTASASDTSDELHNIIDMPIIFADNDGNLTETVSITKAATATQSPIILTPTASTPNKGGTYVINTSTLQQQQKAKPNKVVFINRNTMKPCPNIISRSTNVPQLQKYTKVVVTNSKTSATTLVTRPSQQQLMKPNEMVIKQLNLHSLKPTGSMPPTSTGTSGANSSTSSPTILNLKQFQLVNVDPDKQKIIKSVIPTSYATPTSDSSPTIKNTIVIKPGNLKQVSGLVKPQLLQRNLTVRKVVNLVPTAKTSGVITTTVSQLQSGAASNSVATAVNSGSTPTASATMLRSRSPSF